MSVALRVDDVSVTFRQFVDTTPTVRRAIGRGRLREATNIEALKGVTFTVDKGEAFGVVGRNGAGKGRPLHSYGSRAGDLLYVFDALWSTLSGVASISRKRP